MERSPGSLDWTVAVHGILVLGSLGLLATALVPDLDLRGPLAGFFHDDEHGVIGDASGDLHVTDARVVGTVRLAETVLDLTAERVGDLDEFAEYRGSVSEAGVAIPVRLLVGDDDLQGFIDRGSEGPVAFALDTDPQTREAFRAFVLERGTYVEVEAYSLLTAPDLPARAYGPPEGPGPSLEPPSNASQTGE